MSHTSMTHVTYIKESRYIYEVALQAFGKICPVHLVNLSTVTVLSVSCFERMKESDNMATRGLPSGGRVQVPSVSRGS